MAARPNKLYNWYNNGRLCKQTLDPEGEKPYKEFLPNNVQIKYSYTMRRGGIVHMKSYRKNGKPHRVGGPALIFYHDNGSIESEFYYQNGERHRDGGPAIIDYDFDGTVTRKEYFIEGTRVCEYNG